MNFGEMLISKIIDYKSPEILSNYKIERHHFQTEAERQAYDFILDYVEHNRQVPDARTLAANISEDFTYLPDVTDSFEYLASGLKSYSAKVRAAKLIENEMAAKFQELDGVSFIKWMQEEANKIEQDTIVQKSIGNSLSSIKNKFKNEYENRKLGKTNKTFNTPFPSLTREVSGWQTSDIFGIMAESGRGKTMLSIAIIHDLLKQGANVLVKSFEVKMYMWVSRLFSMITAEEEAVYSTRYNQYAGLENRKLLTATLSENEEEVLFKMLDKIDSYYPGTLYLQCKGDDDLTRTLDDLDRELQQNPQIDAVFLDPFYGLTDVYSGKNANKTAGGAAEAAANRFEIICGVHDVCGFYAVQATVEKQKQDESGARELKLPKRDQVKTSKRLLDIATVLLSWDSVDSIARIGIEKGRNGGEGFEVELIALMDVGVIKEPPNGEDISKHIVDTDIF
jgi:replicative DNA helicase